MQNDYVVLSSGHGSCYTFGSEALDLGEQQPVGTMTKEQADKEVKEWEDTADTIGGRAIALHVPLWDGDLKKFHHCGGRCPTAQRLAEANYAIQS